MKTLLTLGLLLLGTNSYAAWTETVECMVERGSVDYAEDAPSIQITTTQISLNGPHNGENGAVIIQNSLIPSYKVVFDKFSGGRTDEVGLTTTYLGKVLAKSSMDTQQASVITNRFLTANGDYQITITCSSH